MARSCWVPGTLYEETVARTFYDILGRSAQVFSRWPLAARSFNEDSIDRASFKRRWFFVIQMPCLPKGPLPKSRSEGTFLLGGFFLFWPALVSEPCPPNLTL